MIRTIGIIGLGVIGHTVAGHFAMYGYPVTGYDKNPAATERALEEIREELGILVEEGLLKQREAEAAMQRIRPCASLEEAVRGADYILENIDEDLAAKQALFRELEELCKEEAILASNTSSLPLADVTLSMTAPGRTRAMLSHWFTPGHIIPLVELSDFGNMSPERYREVEELYRKIDKKPVRVRKDIPGLIANRLQHAVAREALAMAEQGIADIEDIDQAFQFGPAFRYATTGPFAAADFNGLDVFCKVEDRLLPELDRSTRASPLLRVRVEQGKLGVKSGEGFYSYPGEKKVQARRAFNRRLLRQWSASREY